jgi:hypothetical protein
MNSQERINELQQEIEKERYKIDHCCHIFGEPFSNPEKFMEGYGSKLMHQGSDCWTEFEGYKEAFKPRWTRTCNKCGHQEHTYKRKPVISDYVPDFGKE